MMQRLDQPTGLDWHNLPLLPVTEKRKADFHALFRSVPEDDDLIEDFACALHREIFVQGRLYITHRHICFNARILGWVTNVSFNFLLLAQKHTYSKDIC